MLSKELDWGKTDELALQSYWTHYFFSAYYNDFQPSMVHEYSIIEKIRKFFSNNVLIFFLKGMEEEWK